MIDMPGSTRNGHYGAEYHGRLTVTQAESVSVWGWFMTFFIARSLAARREVGGRSNSLKRVGQDETGHWRDVISIN
ncbi:MAG: hypothetical protein ABI728_14680 [Betaproteobacteria bacterium]